MLVKDLHSYILHLTDLQSSVFHAYELRHFKPQGRQGSPRFQGRPRFGGKSLAWAWPNQAYMSLALVRTRAHEIRGKLQSDRCYSNIWFGTPIQDQGDTGGSEVVHKRFFIEITGMLIFCHICYNIFWGFF